MKKSHVYILAAAALLLVLILLMLRCNGDKITVRLRPKATPAATPAAAARTVPGYIMPEPKKGKAAGTAAGGVNVYDAWLIKVDAKGDCQWARTYPNGYYGWAETVLPLSAGGYVAAVKSCTFGEDYDGVYFMEVDAAGNTLSRVRLDAKEQPELKYAGKAGTVFAGRAYSEDGGNYSAYMAVGGRDGAYRWIKSFGAGLLDWGYTSVMTRDGSYVTTINEDSHAGMPDRGIYLTIRDAGGAYSGKKLAEGSGYAIAQCADGGFIIAGQGGAQGAVPENACLLMSSDEGALKWEIFYGGGGLARFYGVEQQPDSGFMACGSAAAPGADTFDAYLVKTDREGNVKWEKRFGGAGDDAAYFVARTADGGYIVAGATQNISQ